MPDRRLLAQRVLWFVCCLLLATTPPPPFAQLSTCIVPIYSVIYSRYYRTIDIFIEYIFASFAIACSQVCCTCAIYIHVYSFMGVGVSEHERSLVRFVWTACATRLPGSISIQSRWRDMRVPRQTQARNVHTELTELTKWIGEIAFLRIFLAYSISYNTINIASVSNSDPFLRHPLSAHTSIR